MSNKTALTDNLIVFKINFKTKGELMKDQVYKIEVLEHHKGRMEPYPKTIKVYEKQQVELFDSKYFLSVYPSLETINIYHLNVDELHFKSQEPLDETQSSISYGPYKNVEPLTFDQIQLMFTFKYPLPTITEAKRDIYVSHWGNIAIDEYFNIHNDAAGINGQFSRVDYQPQVNPN